MLHRFALMILAGLTGCEQRGNSDARDIDAPANKRELVAAVGADEFGLQLNRPRLGRYPLNAGICEPLVRMTSDCRVAPSLASRWSYLGDNTYRFTLRRGVTFHDGTSLDAGAIKYTLDRAIAEKTQNSFLSDKSVRIVDDTTVDIHPAIPNLRLLEQLGHPSYGVVANGSDPATHPSCTGAFKFAEYLPQNHLPVVRNDAYWGEKAKLDRITFRFIPDDNTRALALRAVRMADPAIRRAVAMAIDRKSLVDQVMEGQSARVNTINPPAVLGAYEEVAAIPLAGVYRIYAMSSKVKGFDPHPSRVNQSWTTVWMAR